MPYKVEPEHDEFVVVYYLAWDETGGTVRVDLFADSAQAEARAALLNRREQIVESKLKQAFTELMNEQLKPDEILHEIESLFKTWLVSKQVYFKEGGGWQGDLLAALRNPRM